MLRELRKQQLKDQIFAKAMQLIVEKGYDNVTVEEIASACGVAKGTFFNYFPKKEQLLLQLGRSQIQVLEQSLEMHSSIGDLKERISSIFRDLLSRYHEVSQSELLKLVLSETIRSALLMREESHFIAEFQEKLTGLLYQARNEGKLKSRFPSATIASVLVALYFNTLMTTAMTSQADANPANSLYRLLTELDLIWEGVLTK